jgi:excisionase family DNA binding protein
MTATYQAPAHEYPPVGTSSAVGLTIEEAAHVYGVSVNTMRRWVKRGRVRSERIQRPQGYTVRVFCDGQVPAVGTTHEVPPQNGHSEVPPLDTYPQVPAIAQLLEPLARELGAARAQIAEQAETIGTLRAQLAALQQPALEAGVAFPHSALASDLSSRPWYQRWWRRIWMPGPPSRVSNS